MSLPEPPSPARRASLPDLLGSTWTIYRERFASFYLAAAMTLAASWTVNLIIKVGMVGEMPLGALEDPRAPEFLRVVGRVFVAGVANGMVYAVFNSIAGATLTLCVLPREGAAAPGPARAFGEILPRLGSLVGSTLLFFLAMAGLVGAVTLVIGVAAALGVVGGLAAGLMAGLVAIVVSLAAVVCLLYLSLRWALYPQVIAQQDLGPYEALARSARLTRWSADPHATALADRYIVRAAVLMLILVALQLVAGVMGAAPAMIAGLVFRASGDLSQVSVINPTGAPLYLLIPLELFSVMLSAAILPYGIVGFILLYGEVSRERQEAPRS